MLERTHVYDFSFVFPTETDTQLPCLTLTFSRELFEPLYQQLVEFAKRERQMEFVGSYLLDEQEFYPLTVDMFGYRVFGY